MEQKKNRKAKLTVLGDSMTRGTGSIIADRLSMITIRVFSQKVDVL